MPPKRPQGWLDRITTSIRRHETDRREARSSLARYEIQAEIGRGGMGVVHRAWDTRLGREVALKVLSEEAGSSAEARERFLREAEVAARLTHPNIIPVYDIGDSEGQVFFAMQLVDGARLDHARLDLRAALSALRDAARAVHYAHEKGIVHRDLKPSNLMVDRQGTVYVMDFGLARRSNAAAQLTLTGRILGTPSYMPPEQARGQPTDARSDVYSLGATMYEVLSGKPPFEGPNELQILKSVLLDEPRPPRRHNPAIPADVEAVILKAMDKKPAGRYGSAAALAEDIDRYLKGEPVLAPTRGTFYRLRKKVVRHRWRITAVASLATLLVLLGFLAWVEFRRYQLDLIRNELLNEARRKYSLEIDENDPKRRMAILKEVSALLAKASVHWLDLDEEIKGWTSYDQAIGESDLERKIEKLKQAMAWVPGAPIELDWAYEQKRLMESPPSPPGSPLAQLIEAFHKAIGDGDIAEGRRLHEKIKTQAPSVAEGLLPQLLRADFARALKGLMKCASEGKAAEFVGIYREIPEESREEWKRELIGPVFALARRLANDGAFVEAIRWFDEAQSLGFQELLVLFEQRSLARIEIKDWDNAHKDYMEFWARRPSSHPPDRRFARLLHHRGRRALDREAWDDALRELSQAVYIDPANAEALHDQGRARYRAKGLYAEALADLGEALKLQPDLKPHTDFAEAAVEFARKKAEASWKLESADERKKAWNESIIWLDLILSRLDGDSSPLLIERARMKRRLGQIEAAMEDARKAGDAPEAVLLRGQLGYVLGWKGAVPDRKRLEEFLAEMEKSSPDPGYWKFASRLALALTDPPSIDPQRLIKELRPWLASIHSNQLRCQMATLLANVGSETPTSPDFLKEALDLADLVLKAPMELTKDDYVAGLCERDGLSYGQAILHLERDARLVRAKVHYGLKDYPLAVRDCDRAIEVDVAYSMGFFLRGASQYHLKAYEAAERDFRKVLEISKDPEEIKDAREWLKLVLNAKGKD